MREKGPEAARDAIQISHEATKSGSRSARASHRGRHADDGTAMGCPSARAFTECPSLQFVAGLPINFAESFSTSCRMILPDLNLTFAMAGMTKLLPG